jgi:hypothetical protein
MADVYYLGDLCYILDYETWINLCNKLTKQENQNTPLVFQKGNKDISCYINQTQHGDGGYELYNMDIHDVTNIIYYPSEICVDSGTIGLICLNQLCSDDSELSKLVKEIKESDYGLVFTVDKAKLELSEANLKLGSEIKPVLTVEATEEDNTIECPYCGGAGYFDDDNEEEGCYACHQSGEIEETYNAFSHEVKLGHHSLFKILT